MYWDPKFRHICPKFCGKFESTFHSGIRPRNGELTRQVVSGSGGSKCPFRARNPIRSKKFAVCKKWYIVELQYLPTKLTTKWDTMRNERLETCRGMLGECLQFFEEVKMRAILIHDARTHKTRSVATLELKFA